MAVFDWFWMMKLNPSAPLSLAPKKRSAEIVKDVFRLILESDHNAPTCVFIAWVMTYSLPTPVAEALRMGENETATPPFWVIDTPVSGTATGASLTLVNVTLPASTSLRLLLPAPSSA